ncbi:DUF423 domain-containing protein [Pseudidiomarina terrestris]|uniref:DUF423 domain-containing protein n=1 Tax=Pseudidiomarina terrestris TaxID=2820060 RepID=A0AAW7QYU3_9GAMM|nr:MULTISPECIES: DUF423 domain-containing protein [unclassified Pseudidiomarina]MDN7125038.1 DUF423 domain-containing protein [Pseudidiomarina sp. 1APP75-32.1]MDN7128207.1 DUF423 domain-containing protein [Pseudidiomarina sp. 1APR75-33.1]MDN7129487.1 DUF423 domain-containing protein [Pseudidiomarina sp. 1APR75-15]MDN7135803.1 DUF423 domain-containing protein [Pseudidiomarina sp. 1ASP75-5]MDN7138253.1 DUF423 domain-containing protein [Pseudidiomarina sp. 1ASP75-14]
MKLFAMLGAINMALGVILGAFGAHGLKGKLSPEMLAVFQTGVQYQIYHALGLLLVAALLLPYPQATGLRTGGWLLLAGIILFSGSLYLLAVTGAKFFGPVTPIGGACFIIGWIWIFWAMLKEF